MIMVFNFHQKLNYCHYLDVIVIDEISAIQFLFFLTGRAENKLECWSQARVDLIKLFIVILLIPFKTASFYDTEK
jgi:hypothetical protein